MSSIPNPALPTTSGRSAQEVQRSVLAAMMPVTVGKKAVSPTTAAQKPATTMDKLKQYTLGAKDKLKQYTLDAKDKLKQYTVLAGDRLKAVESDTWIHIGIFVWLLILTVIVGVYLDRLLKWQKSLTPASSSTGGTTGGTTDGTKGPPRLSDAAITWLVFLIIFLLVLLVSAFMYLKQNIVVEERPYVFLMVHGLLFISIMATSVNAINKINA